MLAGRERGSGQLVAQVNYPSQKTVLNDYVTHSDLFKSVRELVNTHGTMQVCADDILRHLKLEYGKASAGHKHAGLLSTLLENGPRALRLLYEVVEEVARQHSMVEGEGAASAVPVDVQSKIRSLIRQDLSVPAMHRVPYTLKLLPPEKMKPLCLHELRGCHTGHLVELRGLVSRVSPARPLLQLAVYRCESCAGVSYHPVESATFTPLKFCARDAVCRKKKNTLNLSLEDSHFISAQSVWIQEMPENVPSGKVPHQIKLLVKGTTLAHLIRPGRAIRVRGFYMVQQVPGAAYRGGNEAESVPLIDVQDVQDLSVVAVDFAEIAHMADLTRQQLQSGHKLYHTLAHSLAPTIHGHDDVKKALVLQLVGGVRIDDKVRGSIHVLLVGDPGIAKSQILLRMCCVASRSKYTCGRGVSGVGLTACVTKDAGTGEFTLQAGATVLADQGICCIDEFDKMNDQDRTAIHEVMEQQTVSISKAGIVATLNARTSILAAANPVGGRYNVEKSVIENVGLPAALLSRFDFVFLMLDECTNQDRDVDMARHLLSVHRNHGQATIGAELVLQTPVVRELILRAQACHPYLPKSLHEEVVRRYVAVRNSPQQESYVTARTLTGLMRVSQALAKLRFAEEISLEDVEEAERLLHASKSSVIAHRQQKLAANVDPQHKLAAEFLLSLPAGAVYEYEECARQAAAKGISAADFDAVVNDLNKSGQLAYTDVQCHSFRRF